MRSQVEERCVRGEGRGRWDADDKNGSLAALGVRMLRTGGAGGEVFLLLLRSATAFWENAPRRGWVAPAGRCRTSNAGDAAACAHGLSGCRVEACLGFLVSGFATCWCQNLKTKNSNFPVSEVLLSEKAVAGQRGGPLTFFSSSGCRSIYAQRDADLHRKCDADAQVAVQARSRDGRSSRPRRVSDVEVAG